MSYAACSAFLSCFVIHADVDCAIAGHRDCAYPATSRVSENSSPPTVPTGFLLRSAIAAFTLAMTADCVLPRWYVVSYFAIHAAKTRNTFSKARSWSKPES